MKTNLAALKNTHRRFAGQSLMEVSLIGGLIAVVCLLAATQLGNQMGIMYNNIANQIITAVNTAWGG